MNAKLVITEHRTWDEWSWELLLDKHTTIVVNRWCNSEKIAAGRARKLAKKLGLTITKETTE